jgi:hypothetical protein
MSRHKDRMATIGGWALPPDDTSVGKAFREFLAAQPPSRKVRDAWKTATARLLAQIENGAGLPMDSRLRYFLQEYNDRNFRHGLRSMPASFNVLEATMVYHPDLSYFRLCEESDHIVSFLDFLDYVTSPASPPSDVATSVNLLKEGVIYSYNSLSNPGDVTFSVRLGVDYAVGGFAVVRHAQEVTVMLLAGEKTNIAQKTQELRADPTLLGKRPRGKEKIVPANDRVREAVPLLGNPDFWEVLVVARYDLADRSEDARYIMRDAGDSFVIITDDVTVFMDDRTGEFADPKHEAIAKSMASEISEHATLFELCKTFMLLPAYFEEYTEQVRVERHPTKFAAAVKKGQWITKQKRLTSAERVGCRNVLLLDKTPGMSADTTLYRAPEFHVQVSGYWRSLPVQEAGEDKYGNQIHGRTWVRRELSWIQKRDDMVVRAERTQGGTVKRASDVWNVDPGYIYVMHNPAHEKDIFKVGLTRRTSDLRSEELSGTGAPDKFLVAHEWRVRDCVAAERAIHQALDAYRINPKREFFRLQYQELLGTISSIVADLT